MFERFDKDARRAVVRAAETEASALGSRTVEAEHLLLALAADEGDATRRLLAESGLGHAALREALERETERSLAVAGVSAGEFALATTPSATARRPKFAASAKRALERSLRVAVARKDRRITASHLLVGILRAEIGTVPRALAAGEVDRVELMARAERLLD